VRLLLANEVAVSPLSAYEIRFKVMKGLFPGGEVLAAKVDRSV
jgi:PIN domain nuclease of toxin-antitoxin system